MKYMDEMSNSIKSTKREIIFKFHQLMNTYKAEQMLELVGSLKNETFPETEEEIETWNKCLFEIQEFCQDKKTIQKQLIAKAILQLKLIKSK